MRLPLLAAAALCASAFGPEVFAADASPAANGPVPATLPPSDGAPTDEILVTAAREPVSMLLSGVSASVIDLSTIRATQLPQVTDYLRLVPGVAVSVSGPLGELSEVRIRGAEARHTLVFVDGYSLERSRLVERLPVQHAARRWTDAHRGAARAAIGVVG